MFANSKLTKDRRKHKANLRESCIRRGRGTLLNYY